MPTEGRFGKFLESLEFRFLLLPLVFVDVGEEVPQPLRHELVHVVEAPAPYLVRGAVVAAVPAHPERQPATSVVKYSVRAESQVSYWRLRLVTL